MKRKLVSYDVFSQMQENSKLNALKELAEAETHLARTLNLGSLKLSSFNDDQVIYEQEDGTYLKANYDFVEGKISFKNIEQIVIDEQSEVEQRKSIIRDMVESILDDKKVQAEQFFDKYLEMVSKTHKRENESLDESYARLYGSKERTKGKGQPVISYRPGTKDPKKSQAAKLGHRRHQSAYRRGVAKRKRTLSTERARRKRYKPFANRLKSLNSGNYKVKKKMNEWAILSENIFGYFDFKDNACLDIVLNENEIVIPTTEKRNEAKLLKMHHDNMVKNDIKVLRESAKRLGYNESFCKNVSEVKRYNNISDATKLQETIENLVRVFPSVIYLTETEMQKTIAYALEVTGNTNYDDEICKFMAEGILRGAHHIYSDRVERILKIADSKVNETEDKYVDFQNTVNSFYPRVDETFKMEAKIFEDLYEAVSEIRQVAIESGNDEIHAEAQSFINELQGIVDGKFEPNLELATDIAEWIEDILESNDWDVVKNPHVTDGGNNPVLSKLAKISGTPEDNPSPYGDKAAQIGLNDMGTDHDDEGKGHGFGNVGGKDVYPDLTNPHYLDGEHFGVTGEKNDDGGLGSFQSDDTLNVNSGLSNPYLPKAFVPTVNDPNKV